MNGLVSSRVSIHKLLQSLSLTVCYWCKERFSNSSSRLANACSKLATWTLKQHPLTLCNCVYCCLCFSIVVIVDFEQVFGHRFKPSKVIQVNSEL